MSLQWSQPLNLSQVLVYSLGCERGRGWILIYSIAVKYFRVTGMIDIYVYATDFTLKRRIIYSVPRKMRFILGKFRLQSRDTMPLKSFFIF